MKLSFWDVLNIRTRLIKESFNITFDHNFIQNSKPTYAKTHVTESNASSPGSPNSQVIHEVDFESLFRLVEITIDSESRSKPSSTQNPHVSQTISGRTPTFPPFDFEVFPSRIEGENASTSMPQG